MQKLLSLFVLFIGLCFSVQVSAQWGWSGVKGNGNVVTETRSIKSDFEEVKVSTGLNVFIKQGNDIKVVVKADENLQEIIITEVRGNALKIYAEKGIKRAEKLDVFVTMPVLTKLVASAGADAYIKEVFKTEEIVLSTSSGADINANIKAKSVDASTSSGSDIKVYGETDYFKGSASSGSDLNARELRSKVAKAEASSGADLTITATEEIKAHASSGGDVTYYGKPSKVDTSESSGGDVDRR
jgi:hypothetical protein